MRRLTADLRITNALLYQLSYIGTQKTGKRHSGAGATIIPVVQRRKKLSGPHQKKFTRFDLRHFGMQTDSLFYSYFIWDFRWTGTP